MPASSTSDRYVVGFSGSRDGLIKFQRDNLREVLAKIRALHPDKNLVFQHGDCVGCDAQAHDIAIELGYIIEIRPPRQPKLRAFKEGDVVHSPKTYAHRNWDIVNTSDCLVATPRASSRGTLMTMKFAKKVNLP